MKPGDLVLFPRYSDGTKIVGRLTRGLHGSCLRVVDARGVAFWRAPSELTAAARGDMRVAEFLRREGQAPVPKAASTPPEAHGEPAAPKLADRILLELQGGRRTARALAEKLDAMADSVGERLLWLEGKGRVARDGHDGGKWSATVWRLTEATL